MEMEMVGRWLGTAKRDAGEQRKEHKVEDETT